MTNALIGSLAATARSAGLAAQQAAAQTARRLAAIAIVALVAAAALIGSLVFVVTALHRTIADAAGPTAADLILAGILLVVAIVTIAILASLGRINRPPSHGAAGSMGQRPSGARFAATGSSGSPPPPPPPPQEAARTLAGILAGVDKSWIFGAVAAAFIIGMGLGRRR